MKTLRSVRPEALDDLSPEDPLAMRSRRDLRRVHRAMRTVSVLNYAISRLQLESPPMRILELGAGDGSLLLRLAASIKPRWPHVKLTSLDRQSLVSSETIASYRELGWEVTRVCEDALVWARRAKPWRYDLIITTLFLHHLIDSDLRDLLRGIASQSRAFIAIEPRRDHLAHMGSRLIGLLGTNAITREDAVKSVAAGFTGEEITSAWPPTDYAWETAEFRVLPFSHVFIATRDPVAYGY